MEEEIQNVKTSLYTRQIRKTFEKQIHKYSWWLPNNIDTSKTHSTPTNLTKLF